MALVSGIIIILQMPMTLEERVILEGLVGVLGRREAIRLQFSPMILHVMALDCAHSASHTLP